MEPPPFTAASLAAQLAGRGCSFQHVASHTYLSFVNALCAAPLLTASSVLYIHAADGATGTHHLFSESGRYVTVGVSPADGAAITCARPTAGAGDAFEVTPAEPPSDAAGSRLVHITLGGWYVMVRGTSALLSHKPIAASTFRVVVHPAAPRLGVAAVDAPAAIATSSAAVGAPAAPLAGAAAFAVPPPATVEALAGVMSLAQAQPPASSWPWMRDRADGAAAGPADGAAAGAFEAVPVPPSPAAPTSVSAGATSTARLNVTLRHGARIAIETADHPAIGVSGRARVVSAFQRVDERGVQLRLEPTLADRGCTFTVVRPCGDDRRFALWSPYGHFVSATALAFDPGVTADDLAAAAGQAARDDRRRSAAARTTAGGSVAAAGAASGVSPFRPSPSAGTAVAASSGVDDDAAAGGDSRFASPAASAGGGSRLSSSHSPAPAGVVAARGAFTTPVGRRLADSLGGHPTPATPQSPLAGGGDDAALPFPATPYPPAVRSAAVASFPPLPLGTYLRFFPVRRPLTVCDLFDLVPVPALSSSTWAAAGDADALAQVETRFLGGSPISRLSGVGIRCCGVGAAPAPDCGAAALPPTYWAVGPDSLVKDNMYAHGVLHAPLPPPPVPLPAAAAGAAAAAAVAPVADGTDGLAVGDVQGHPLFTFHIYDCGRASPTEMQRATAVARGDATGAGAVSIPVRADADTTDAYEAAARQGLPLGCHRPPLTAIDDNSGIERLALPPVARAWAVSASALDDADDDSDGAAVAGLVTGVHGLAIGDGRVRAARLLDGSLAPADGVTPPECTALQPTPSLGANHLSIMTYNILADSMARLSPDEHCHPHFNQWQAYRWPRVAADIKALAPTIVCLQEVDPSAYDRDIRPFMESLGYEGMLVEETGPAFGRDLMKQVRLAGTVHG